MIILERGAKRRYTLAKSLKNINIKEIVEILEGKTLLFDCVNSEKKCIFKNRSPIYDLWCELVDTVHNCLKSKTLQDLVVD